MLLKAEFSSVSRGFAAEFSGDSQRFTVGFDSVQAPLKAEFSNAAQVFTAGFSESSGRFAAGVDDFQTLLLVPENTLYEGSYEVVPSVNSQILPTSQKYMTEDVRIEAIPYAEVSNTAGGSTATIG